ncbi:hypothetical protein BU17DRAFT_82908 [Hysterangium stoloniferum]|nr:hypothetical protein BU17DRAFT_82908 [Hysterangium stoloniferum]
MAIPDVLTGTKPNPTGRPHQFTTPRTSTSMKDMVMVRMSQTVRPPGRERLQVAQGQSVSNISRYHLNPTTRERERRDKTSFNYRGELPTRLDKQLEDASVRQHLRLTWGGNKSESQSRMSNYPPQRSAQTLGGPLAARMEPLPRGAPPPQCNRRRKEK